MKASNSLKSQLRHMSLTIISRQGLFFLIGIALFSSIPHTVSANYQISGSAIDGQTYIGSAVLVKSIPQNDPINPWDPDTQVTCDGYGYTYPWCLIKRDAFDPDPSLGTL